MPKEKTADKATKKTNVKRGLDKAEGKASKVTGAKAHSREKHGEMSPADLKKRILAEKKKIASTFTTKKDQDGAVSAALKTADGKKTLAEAKSKGGRHTLKAAVSGSFKCTVSYPYVRTDGKKDAYTVHGQVREVTVVIDGKGGEVSIQTAYPSDFHLP